MTTRKICNCQLWSKWIDKDLCQNVCVFSNLQLVYHHVTSVLWCFLISSLRQNFPNKMVNFEEIYFHLSNTLTLLQPTNKDCTQGHDNESCFKLIVEKMFINIIWYTVGKSYPIFVFSKGFFLIDKISWGTKRIKTFLMHFEILFFSSSILSEIVR